MAALAANPSGFADQTEATGLPGIADRTVSAKWDKIFGDEVMPAALIDRLFHYSSMVNIRGTSLQLRLRNEFW